VSDEVTYACPYVPAEWIAAHGLSPKRLTPAVSADDEMTPGASHCATEGRVIADAVRSTLGLPVIELEVPSLSDAMAPAIRNRLEALVELALSRREIRR